MNSVIPSGGGGGGGGGGSAVSGMDGITLTDMGGGWVLSPCDQIAADAYWTKNLWNFKIIKFENMHYYYIITLDKRLPAKIRGNNQPDTCGK